MSAQWRCFWIVLRSYLVRIPEGDKLFGQVFIVIPQYLYENAQTKSADLDGVLVLFENW
jgi:hypothetical protein